MSNPANFDREFESFLSPRLANKSVAERINEINQLYDLWQKEHAVPVDGQLVWIGSGTQQHRHASSTTAATNAKPKRTWLLIALIAFMVLAFFLKPSSSAIRDPNILAPVSADRNSINAPATLVIQDNVFNVLAFDPVKHGWPDPAMLDDTTIMWGGTTINLVFGMQGDTFAMLDKKGVLAIGESLSIQQLSSVTQVYRISERLTVQASDITPAQQRETGVTLIGFADNGQRTIVRAIPRDVPQTHIPVGESSITIDHVAWIISNLQQSIVVSLTFQPLQATGTVRYRDQVLAQLPITEPQQVRMIVDARDSGPSIIVPLTVGDTTVNLDIPLPAPPYLSVIWEGVYQQPSGIVVVTTLQGSANIIQANDVGCLVSNQPRQMTASIPLPLAITDEQQITWMCTTDLPRGALAEVWVGDQRISVTLP